MAEKRVNDQQKKAVSDRARGCCEYCRSQEAYAVQAFSVEHIEPRQRGGRNTLNNLALSCQGCNNHKYVRIEAPDPITGDMVRLYHPRRQHWADHFAWNEDFTLIIGLTPTGRATVAALRLNREPVVNLRRVLHALGLHPPPEPAE